MLGRGAGVDHAHVAQRTGDHFVLAADTGVTKSDLNMWNDHVRGSRHAGNKGLVVAMNKIDSLWGDLGGEEATEKTIRSQVSDASRILGVDEALIFPVSANRRCWPRSNAMMFCWKRAG